jgi:hypothetical protein
MGYEEDERIRQYAQRVAEIDARHRRENAARALTLEKMYQEHATSGYIQLKPPPSPSPSASPSATPRKK